MANKHEHCVSFKKDCLLIHLKVFVLLNVSGWVIIVVFT